MLSVSYLQINLYSIKFSLRIKVKIFICLLRHFLFLLLFFLLLQEKIVKLNLKFICKFYSLRITQKIFKNKNKTGGTQVHDNKSLISLHGMVLAVLVNILWYITTQCDISSSVDKQGNRIKQKFQNQNPSHMKCPGLWWHCRAMRKMAFLK